MFSFPVSLLSLAPDIIQGKGQIIKKIISLITQTIHFVSKPKTINHQERAEGKWDLWLIRAFRELSNKQASLESNAAASVLDDKHTCCPVFYTGNHQDISSSWREKTDQVWLLWYYYHSGCGSGCGGWAFHFSVKMWAGLCCLPTAGAACFPK